LHAALGASDGTAYLSYPANATWLGVIHADRPSQSGENIVCEVPVRRLDALLPAMAAKTKVLIKIDVEGRELDVLRGGDTVLRTIRPAIILESNTGHDRPALQAYLGLFGYRIYELPYHEGETPLNLSPFVSSLMTNFMCLP
jgi:hypothetical protein